MKGYTQQAKSSVISLCLVLSFNGNKEKSSNFSKTIISIDQCTMVWVNTPLQLAGRSINF